jgi:hypothetical protein
MAPMWFHLTRVHGNGVRTVEDEENTTKKRHKSMNHETCLITV